MGNCERLDDLKRKEVVSVADGSRLGYPVDFAVDVSGARIEGIVLEPGGRPFFFGRRNFCTVPWSAVRRIGDDIILVDYCVPEIDAKTAMNAGPVKTVEGILEKAAKKF